ncbi:MAG: SDR family oxidoreductase [bacterium]|nr:SDR family oxidoreductase [bacterium]MDE0239003.1 SDR family oxidoreductase [bacterium]MDE0416392.1 SDR family oxidoreductase [bacterium]
MSQGVMIVTGGSRGIGAEIARLAGRRGYDVAVNYSASRDRAEEVAESVRAEGRRAAAIRADVSRPDDIESLFEETDRLLGAPAVLVNNAGISVETPLADHEVDTVRRIIDTNLLGPALTSRQAIRRMSTARGGTGGVIVNVSSISGVYGGLPGDVVYASTKGGLDSLTLGLAKEVAGEGIRVCCVRPGLIKTEIWDDGMGQDEVIELGKRAVPLGRIGDVGDIATAVLWMCSDEAAYVTGAILNVSGGRETFVRGG